LQHLQRTFREEAGHAALVASKLDDQTKAELKAITVHDLNMLDMVQGWLGTAKQLGEVEEARVRLANTGAGSGGDANRISTPGRRSSALASRSSTPLSVPDELGGLPALEPVFRISSRVRNCGHLDAVRQLAKENDVRESLGDGPPEATISIPDGESSR
jgi:hypothetical protein